jgi:DNA-binding MarR family transcriptional regulator
MQATPAAALDARTALARDLYAVVMHIMRSGNEEAFRALAEFDLSLTQVKAAHLLDGIDEATSVKHLADLVGVSLPAMSRSIDGLHSRGFVERHEDPDDRRMKRVRITDAGRDVVRALHEARLSTLQGFLDSLDDDQVARLAAALEPVAARDDIARCRPLKDRHS